MPIFGKSSAISVLIFVFTCAFWVVACASEKKSIEDSELEKAALILMSRVLDRDIKLLASFVGDECDELDSSKCKFGMDSYTYDFLYNDSWGTVGQLKNNDVENAFKSVSTILKTIKPNLAMLFERFSLEDSIYGSGNSFVRVYYYDPKTTQLVLPLSKEARNRWMKDYVSCLFIKKGNNWGVAYTLFESETEGP